ncbi:hypothetical protein LUX12_09185 [Streptomyces somaliensis]|nr:hypothetical protein [Streptomyces somaliensis]MCP9944909.1 hypothetical protein [Streptomyces somaliensis]
MPASVSVVAPASWAIPKSVRTTRPVASSTSTLAGFRSRWSTPIACAARSADSSARPILAASRASTGPRAAIRSASDTPSTNSITMYGTPSSSTTSWTQTMCGWWTRATARASRSVVSTAASPPLGTPASTWSSFTATGRPSSSSWARHTVPIPPRPNRASRR